MSGQKERIVKRLQERGAETLTFFRALTPEQLESRIYAADGDHPAWNARQLLAHFVSAEESLQRLFHGVAREGHPGASEDFDIDRFNRSKVSKMEDQSAAELIALFEKTRAWTVSFVETLTEEELVFEGRHPFLGVTSLDKMLKLVYNHNMQHERDIKRVLGLRD